MSSSRHGMGHMTMGSKVLLGIAMTMVFSVTLVGGASLTQAELQDSVTVEAATAATTAEPVTETAVPAETDAAAADATTPDTAVAATDGGDTLSETVDATTPEPSTEAAAAPLSEDGSVAYPAAGGALTVTTKVTSTGTGPDSTYKENDTATFTITIKNTGSTKLTGIKFADTMTLKSGTAADNRTPIVSDSSSFDLDVDGTKTITVKYTLTNDDVEENYGYSSLLNKMVATAGDGTTGSTEKSIIVQYLCFTQGLLETSTGTLADGVYAEGDWVTYDYLVANGGTVTWHDTLITEKLPGATILAGTGYTVDQSGRAYIASLSPGSADVYVKIKYQVTAQDVAAGSIMNTADAVSHASAHKYDMESLTRTVKTGTAAPALTVEKTITSTGSAAGGTYAVGDVVSYKIVVTNTGNTALTGITVADTMDGGRTATLSDNSAFDLAFGASKTLTATYTVTQADIDAGEDVGNSATATASGGTTATSPKVDATFKPEALAPALSVDMRDNGSNEAVDCRYVPGSTFNYKVIITNTGNTALTGIVPSVVMDDGRGWTLSDPAAFNLAIGESKTLAATYTVTQADAAAGTVVNVDAHATASDGTTASSRDFVFQAGEATLSVDKTITSTGSAANGTYAAGDKVDYRIVVTNTGDVILHNISVSDTMDGSRTATLSDTTAFELLPGASKTLTATYTVTQADIDAGEAVGNSAAASSHVTPYLTATATSTDAIFTPEKAAPALSVDKSVTSTGSAAGGTYAVGDEVSYLIKVTNSGNVTLKGIKATDVMDGGRTATLSDSTAFDLAPGESKTLTATYTVTQADVDGDAAVGNSATATATDGTTATSVATDATFKPEKAAPALTVAKSVTSTGSAANGTYAVGDEVSYKVVVTNTGNVTLEGVSVTDVMDGGRTATLSDAAAFDLAPGESKTLTATYTVTQADIDGGIAVGNSATATAIDGTTATSAATDATFTPEAVTPAPAAAASAVSAPTVPATSDSTTDVTALLLLAAGMLLAGALIGRVARRA